jgi:hypothetical protein
LVLYILIEEGSCRAFTFNIELEDLPHAGRNIVIAIDNAGSEFNLHYFLFFVVVDAVNGG